jgi:hypothetical protein
MYTKIPEHLKERLFKELKRARLRYVVILYPPLVLILSLLAAAYIFLHGHSIIWLIRKYVPANMSDREVILIGFAIIAVVTAGVAVWGQRQYYNWCNFEDYLYCPKCNAVDNYDNGACPVCQEKLIEKASFFYTTHKEELKIMEGFGLKPCRSAKTL